jgi:lipopolysaccharide biosynthesis regulator YciM
MDTMALVAVSAGLVVAIYIGWEARRFKERRQTRRFSRVSRIPRSYFLGLNFLLNEETDKAVEVLTKMLTLDRETIETHLALGKLFRRRGEVDRAIHIHHNLIARPQLPKRYRERSMYELGQDYFSAGMLDRAEQIFIELSHTKFYAKEALNMLIDIYQQEKDWRHAIEIAMQYEQLTHQKMGPIIAHFYCERAERALLKGDLDKAKDRLAKALSHDPASFRASALQAKMAIQHGDYAQALRSLKAIQHQNAVFLSESIDLLAECYEKLGQEEALIDYLRELLAKHPHTDVLHKLAEYLRKKQGPKISLLFVLDYVRQHPSLRGLQILIHCYRHTTEDQTREDINILQKIMKSVLSHRPGYQCKQCGFSCSILHWQCPGCRHWNTIQPALDMLSS